MTENERLELANLLFPNLEHDREYYENKYPARNLPEGAMVTRFGPSPTGFVHMGSLFGSFIDATFARQSNGVFYLRIEDTDAKRTVEKAHDAFIMTDYRQNGTRREVLLKKNTNEIKQ